MRVWKRSSNQPPNEDKNTEINTNGNTNGNQIQIQIERQMHIIRRGWCERASVIRPPNETPLVMVATVAIVATEMRQFVVINLWLFVSLFQDFLFDIFDMLYI